jgi:hypothetical protein
MVEISISNIGAKLVEACELNAEPLCVYGSSRIPEGVVASTSVSSCVARAIVTLAFHAGKPPIYVTTDMPETCCGGGLAQLGFREFNPGIKYFVSTGTKDFRDGSAEYLRASPELVEESRKRMGKIEPPGRYLIISRCSDLQNEDPGVRSIICFGVAEQIRNMCSLAQFRSKEPFHQVLFPQGASCASFVSYAAGMVEHAPPDSVFVGPCDPTGNYWFPEDHLSLAIPIKVARTMVEDIEQSFLTKRASIAYPKARIQI